jgi:hypothetical protein
MTDRSDAVVVTFNPTDTMQAPTRYVFEPRDDGTHERAEERYSTEQGTWILVGSEIVDSLAVENAPTVDAERPAGVGGYRKVCSGCGWEQSTGNNYCPECGGRFAEN